MHQQIDYHPQTYEYKLHVKQENASTRRQHRTMNSRRLQHGPRLLSETETGWVEKQRVREFQSRKCENIVGLNSYTSLSVFRPNLQQVCKLRSNLEHE